MSSVKVSIIVPVYNVEEYLVKCLDSLVNQTLKDIEIICINDGSTDNSLEILNAYAQRDNRIIVIDKENEGQGIARNLGISRAKGEFIGFVDPDDWVSLEMYEKMYNQAKELDSEIVICDFIKYRDWDGRSWKHHFWNQATYDYEIEDLDVPTYENVDKDFVYKSLLVSPCYSVNRIYKNEFLRNNNIYFSGTRCFEDVIFIIDAMHLAQKISYIDRAYYIYRLRKNSTLRGLDTLTQEALNINKELTGKLKVLHLEEKLCDNLKFFQVMNFIWTYEKLGLIEQRKFLRQLKDKVASDCYKKVNELLKQKKYKKYIKAANKLFYITNKDRHKVINLAGVRFKFKYLKGQAKLEQKYIDKILKNQDKYPKDTYLLFDCLNGDICECIDAYSLFLYLRSIGKKAYYVLMKESPQYRKLESENRLENIIAIDNPLQTHAGDFFEKVYDILLRTKAVITAFGFFSKTGEKFLKSNPHLQYIFIQHGPTFLKESVMLNGYLCSNKYDKLLVSSKSEANIFKKYGFKDEQLIKCGLPRWDLLNERSSESKKSILVMLTWRRFNQLTFDESLYKKNLLSLINNIELHNFLQEKNVKLYLAPHHSLMGLRGIDLDIGGGNIHCVDSNNVSKYIRKCSALITDLSSVAFDFMFQDKPVICYILDKNDSNLTKMDKIDVECFDYKKYIMPNVVFDEQLVVEKIKYYIENNFELEPETKQKYDKFFYTKENIREKLVEEIDKACSEQKS